MIDTTWDLLLVIFVGSVMACLLVVVVAASWKAVIEAKSAARDRDRRVDL
ncbi:MAG TPA: hypothetical protein VMT27_07720 [Actinomycetes bacterium]|nr:hypothetical protein [Actinomycetes bacterium]